MANPNQPAIEGRPLDHPTLKIAAGQRKGLVKPTDRCNVCGKLFSDLTEHPA